MRATVPGLPVAVPLGTMLPSVYQTDDEFLMRFTSGLDDVLAPVVSTLDCLASYVDPLLAPVDFLDWLANWVGLETTFGDTDLPRMRLAVAAAVRLYRLRGTPAGLRDHLELVTGGQVEIVDSGGVVASTTPDTPLPGQDTPRLAIRVTGPAASEPPGPSGLSGSSGSAGLASLVEAVVRASKPAHVRHAVEVVQS